MNRIVYFRNTLHLFNGGKNTQHFLGWSYLFLLLLLIIFTLMMEANGNNFLSEENTIGDILEQPEFEGFSRKLLPWDNERYDVNLKISNISRLMPYHNNIVVDDVLKPLNYMIKSVNKNKKVFFNIYPDGDKRQENTGLFFFSGKENSPFAIVCAGGGFSYVGLLHEGLPIALKLSEMGYNAFVIKYRAGSPNWALEDLAIAIDYIFNNAKKLNVSTNKYSIWGGSAGARMAAYIGSYSVKYFGGADRPRPSAIIMAYTGHNDFTTQQPPTFTVVGEDDWIANPHRMEQVSKELKRSGIETEFHKYKNLGHGFGLGTGTTAEGWVEKAVEFWGRFG